MTQDTQDLLPQAARELLPCAPEQSNPAMRQFAYALRAGVDLVLCNPGLTESQIDTALAEHYEKWLTWNTRSGEREPAPSRERECDEAMREALAVIAYDSPEEPWRVAYDALKNTAVPLASTTAQTEGSGLARSANADARQVSWWEIEELKAQNSENVVASGLAEELAAAMRGTSPRPPADEAISLDWRLCDRILAALSSAPAEFHMGGAAAALAITEPMQSASADVPRAHLEADHEGE